MTVAKKEDGATQEAIARVAGRVQLEEVRLRYLSCVLGAESPKELAADWAEEVRSEREAQVVAPEGEMQEALRDDTSGFIVGITFHAEYWSPDRREAASTDDEALPDVGLYAAFELAYALSSQEGLRYQDLESFAGVNSVFNAWPYWRELAYSATARMGIPNPLLVGVLTVNALLAEE